MGPSSTGRGGKDGRRDKNQNKNSKSQKDGKDGNNKKKPQQHRSRGERSPNIDKKKPSADELSKSIPIPLQQLLLNIFRSALLFSADPEDDNEKRGEPEGRIAEQTLAITPLIQTLKTYLYNRDFISAFADANEDLLRVYALRWSAGRALGYVGVLDKVWRNWVSPNDRGKGETAKKATRHALCIGGGAGAEIVALAGVWRMLLDEAAPADCSISAGYNKVAGSSSINEEGISKLSVRDDCPDVGEQVPTTSPSPEETSGNKALSITAVDIADWTPVVNRLSRAIKSPAVPSSKSCQSPLLAGHDKDKTEDVGFDVSFKHLDVLNLSDEELKYLLCPVIEESPQNQANTSSDPELRTTTDLVTLMFTLNELFSTSIPKATSLLLRMTDILEPGTILLVVDSPGSYSTVALGNKGRNDPSSSPPGSSTKEERDSAASSTHSEQQKPRTYPMRFLLDHALLSVAAGSWECVLSDDSRWFRREAAKLSYDVGEGIGLEDMRFQVHVYRRLQG